MSCLSLREIRLEISALPRNGKGKLVLFFPISRHLHDHHL
ncbi:hypothetical protein OIU77_028554, partial [Salix suchowensis]